jgi:hypothetical protein
MFEPFDTKADTNTTEIATALKKFSQACDALDDIACGARRREEDRIVDFCIGCAMTIFLEFMVYVISWYMIVW